MQDDQGGPKIVILAAADMARLPTSTITIFSTKQPSLLGGTTHTTTHLALPTRKMVCFISTFLPSSS
jgi:hypothetical protein